ncbi:SCAN domain-containing protein 3-like [Oratosquilla oratoria]|uniref:SCAN domain-containing protein 3-like n=1 Tax=Oratosquilla oratoria TaxID=337810 RepID=UPI003F771234
MSPFSVIIDESTDIVCEKHLCVCVRYYNARCNRISSQFLGLISVTSTTSEALYQHLKDYFSSIGVDLRQCFAIGTDGASNLCGAHHSLYTLMKKDIPHLILIKCTCHSLHLACSSHASDELPSNIDFMIRESYSWFHRSSPSYLEIYRLINDGKDPLQLIPLSGTRWLARSSSVKRLLDQCDSLKTHFEMASSSCDRCVVRQLFSMYSDPTNKLYFTFLKPVLDDFEKINLLYQKYEPDQCGLHTELENFTLGMHGRISHPEHVRLDANLNISSIYLPLEKVDFCYEFTEFLTINRQNNAAVTGENLLNKCSTEMPQFLSESLQRAPCLHS